MDPARSTWRVFTRMHSETEEAGMNGPVPEVVGWRLPTGPTGTAVAAADQVHLGVRLLNGLAAAARLPWGGLRLEAIVEGAERATGLHDWGGDEYLKQLRLSVECLVEAAALTSLGEASASIVLRWHAGNRLRLVDWVRQHPEVRALPIVKPIFIVGWFRTGTTNLHTLMGLDPQNRLPLCWELSYPLTEHDDPRRDYRRRHRKTNYKFRLANWLAPEQRFVHELAPDNPEECFFLLANSAVSVEQIMAFQGYQYARELMAQDLSPAYHDLRLQYQILAAQRPGRQWVMKCPFHLWHLDALLRAFPDARIIQTHRRPDKAVASVCSLSAIMSRPFASRFAPLRHGTFFREFCRDGIDRALRVRAGLPESQILDVRLDDLDRDPVGTLQGIYRHFDLPWDNEHMPQRVTGHLADEKRRHAGQTHRHTYFPEQFGLTAAGLREEFSDYESQFLNDSTLPHAVGRRAAARRLTDPLPLHGAAGS